VTEKTINFGLTINLTNYESLRIDLIGYTSFGELKERIDFILSDLAYTNNMTHKNQIIKMIELIRSKNSEEFLNV